MSIILKRENGTISIRSPYDARFVSRVKTIGGKWDSSTKTWNVSDEMELQLKEILTDIYGYVDSDTELIKVRYNANDFNEGKTIQIGSLITVYRPERDRDVIFHNTVVIEGGFPYSGGSVKHPRVCANEGTILQSLIPQSIYDKLSDDEKSKIEIIEIKSHKDKLLAEKEALLKRLAEIDEELKII